jgi:hypothetical protein
MLLLAWLFFIAWIVLMLFVTAAHGFAGPQFWSIHLVLLLGVVAWAKHFARARRRPELPEGYSGVEIVLLCLFVILAVGGVGSCAGIQGYKANQSSRSKRTQADMRAIGTAWEERAMRLNQYNAAGAVTVPALPNAPGIVGNPNEFTLPYTFGPDALEPVLAPTYIKVFPRTDGWGNAWQFATDESFPRGNGTAAQIYLIRSAGANGRFDPIVRGHVANYDCDIIFSNGEFISW